jgi:hypothetical protein
MIGNLQPATASHTKDVMGAFPKIAAAQQAMGVVEVYLIAERLRC